MGQLFVGQEHWLHCPLACLTLFNLWTEPGLGVASMSMCSASCLIHGGSGVNRLKQEKGKQVYFPKKFKCFPKTSTHQTTFLRLRFRAWTEEPEPDQWESINQAVHFLGSSTFNNIRIEPQTNQEPASPMTLECQIPLIAPGVSCTYATLACDWCVYRGHGELVAPHLPTPAFRDSPRFLPLRISASIETY